MLARPCPGPAAPCRRRPGRRWPALLVALAAIALAAIPPPAARAAVFPRDLVYTPLAPCRLLDTRTGTGRLVPGKGYVTDVRGKCGVPEEARAAMLNVVAVAPLGAGHLTLWPYDDFDPPPVASTINYRDPAANLANGVVVTLCEPGEQDDSVCNADLRIAVAVSAVHLVVDVAGYFAPPGAGPLWGQGRPNTKVHGLSFLDFEIPCTNGEIQFVLSARQVDWNGAAAACPAGWWVCTAAERGTATCNTTRVDSVCDWRGCDSGAGSTGAECHDKGAAFHIGWLADGDPAGGWEHQAMGWSQSEDEDTPAAVLGCSLLPVWCCRR